jgi:8-oxo-dGTP pyrophosphatase MutT (NUDIX family)
VLAYPDWVNVIALTNEDNLVLVRQYRHAVGDYNLEVPGGTVDASDPNVELSARRELEEETGYVADHWQPVSVLYANPALQTNRVHVFLAREARCIKPQLLDAGEEGLTVKLVPIQEVLDRLNSGLLGMSMHVSSVLLGLAAAGRIQLRTVLQ